MTISTILIQEANGTEYTQRYDTAEMSEIYTLPEQADLESGHTIRRLDGSTHTDLVAFYHRAN